MGKILELENVSFSYAKDSKGEPALKNLTFSIESKSSQSSLKNGKKIALLGPNGSGKSTTFKIISTQLKGWSGRAELSGFSISQKQSEVRKRLGVCFQSPSLDKILTGRENLVLQGRVLGLGLELIEKEIRDLAETLRVNYLDKRVGDLSGGQARRIEIMKAFLGAPDLLLLDEPTNGLDPQARRDFWNELSHIADRKGISVIVTTHLIEEAEVCDELIFISEGHCVGQGAPRDLRASLGFEILQIELINPAENEKFLAQIQHELQRGSREKAEIIQEQLRISTQRPKELFDIIQGKWSAEIQRIEWAKPTLADVYFEKTGKALI